MFIAGQRECRPFAQLKAKPISESEVVGVFGFFLGGGRYFVLFCLFLFLLFISFCLHFVVF